MEKAFLMEDNDIQEYLLFKSQNKPKRGLQDKENLFEHYNDRNFRKTFHLSKTTVILILGYIENKLYSSYTKRRQDLSPMFQLLLTLRFYATGTFQIVIGDLNKVVQSTVSINHPQSIKRISSN